MLSGSHPANSKGLLSATEQRNEEELDSCLLALRLAPPNEGGRRLFRRAMRERSGISRPSELRLQRVEPGYFYCYPPHIRRIIRQMGFNPDRPDLPGYDPYVRFPLGLENSSNLRHHGDHQGLNYQGDSSGTRETVFDFGGTRSRYERINRV